MANEESPPVIQVGCAGWSVPKEYAAWFPEEGSHLERYAHRFPVVEINSSFYRPHLPATYARWAASVPFGFSFTVKVPREITHLRRLANPEEPLDRFLAECGALEDALGPLLVQLPPSLAFDGTVAVSFFATLRERFAGYVVCEPRHPSWFRPEAEQVLVQHQVARVAADPAPVPPAAQPGGWEGLVYFRLHGRRACTTRPIPNRIWRRWWPLCARRRARLQSGAFSITRRRARRRTMLWQSSIG